MEKIVIQGDPYNRGLAYGSQAKEKIEKAIAIYSKQFESQKGVSWKRAIEFSKTFVKRIKEYDDSIIDELNGMAKGSGREFEEILIINIRTELLMGSKKLDGECTSLCALPEATAGKKTLLAQNWDYPFWAMDHVFLLEIKRKHGPDILTMVEAGQFARMGMNSAGMGICNNFIECEEDGSAMDTTGIPTTFIRRKALEQENYANLIGKIIHSPRSFSGNYLVASAQQGGYAIDIEATPSTAYFIHPKDGLVTHSNHINGAGPHYVGTMRKGVENSIFRDRRVDRELRKKLGNIELDDIKHALSDHFSYPSSVCRHYNHKKTLAEMTFGEQVQTNASLIMDLDERTLWLAEGPPCQTIYKKYSFS